MNLNDTKMKVRRLRPAIRKVVMKALEKRVSPVNRSKHRHFLRGAGRVLEISGRRPTPLYRKRSDAEAIFDDHLTVGLEITEQTLKSAKRLWSFDLSQRPEIEMRLKDSKIKAFEHAPSIKIMEMVLDHCKILKMSDPPSSENKPRKIEKNEGGPELDEVTTLIARSFSGPLPDPATLEGFEKVLPGLANRMIEQVEKQQAHRHHLEKEDLAAATKLEARGQIFGFLLGLVGMLGGMILIGMDKSLMGLVAFLSSLGTLIAAFVYRNRREKDDKSASEE